MTMTSTETRVRELLTGVVNDCLAVTERSLRERGAMPDEFEAAMAARRSRLDAWANEACRAIMADLTPSSQRVRALEAKADALRADVDALKHRVDLLQQFRFVDRGGSPTH